MAEAVQSDRHNTRMQTIYGNPGVLSSSQFSVFYLNCFLKKKKKKEILQKVIFKPTFIDIFEGEHGKLLPGDGFLFFPFPAPCGHSWLQNWINGDTLEVGFFEFGADCVIK